MDLRQLFHRFTQPLANPDAVGDYWQDALTSPPREHGVPFLQNARNAVGGAVAGGLEGVANMTDPATLASLALSGGTAPAGAAMGRMGTQSLRALAGYGVDALDVASNVDQYGVNPMTLMALAGGYAGSRGKSVPINEMVAYHGSPHKFDKFQMDKIGTGEGAQAYGHGLYFAESPGVAKSYQENLAPGVVAKPGITDALQQGLDDTHPEVLREVNDALLMNQDIDDTMRYLHQLDEPMAERAFESFRKMVDSGDLTQNGTVIRFKDYAKSFDFKDMEGAGAFYKVDIPDEQIGKMLDWDKPLSEQPESVRKALESSSTAQRLSAQDATAREAFGDAYPDRWQDREAGAIMREMWDDMGQEAASAALREAGIPGIRYLDQGSRASGDGTRNFVVFDENIVKMLSRE